MSKASKAAHGLSVASGVVGVGAGIVSGNGLMVVGGIVEAATGIHGIIHDVDVDQDPPGTVYVESREISDNDLLWMSQG